MLDAILHNFESVSVFADAFFSAIFSPLDSLLNPSQRLYWLFLFSSLGLSAFVLARHFLPSIQKPLLENIHSLRGYLLNRSSAQDAGWFVLNAVVKVFVLVPIFASHLAATVWVAGGLQNTWGDSPGWALSTTTIMVIFTLTFFVIEDFSRFITHFAMHKIPLLWRLHQVHHSAEVLTPLTVYRVHSLEMVIYYCRQLIVFGAVSGVFVWLFGRELSAMQILGVDALGFAFNVFGANLRHSHVWLSFAWFERFFISPAQHQIHHSKAVEHHDKNFGTCFSVWDYLAGSLVKSAAVKTQATKVRQLEFGLAGE